MSDGKSAGIDQSALTLAKLLREKAGKYGTKKAALRLKHLGIWQETSWQAYYDRSREFALGISALGLQPGEVLAVIGRNRPSSLQAIVGTQIAGGIPVCIHPESTPAEVASFIGAFDIKFILAEDQEQVDKILDNPAATTGLKGIIYCNPRGMRGYADQRLSHLDRLFASGQELHLKEPEKCEQLVSAGSGSDTALICITSGSSGTPRGALLSQKSIVASAKGLVSATGIREGYETVSILPLSWIGEMMISLAAMLHAGFTVNLPESAEIAWEDLREIGPHLIFAPPETWGAIASSVKVRIMETTPFNRFMFKTFLPLGERLADRILGGKPAGPLEKVAYGIAYLALLRALRDRLGLSRVKTALSGGAPIGRSAFRFFHAIGVNLKQVYGLTEISGAAAVQRDDSIRPDSVGLPLAGVEVRIADNGEILLRGDGVFQGYYGDQPSLRDGWLHTGDAGRLENDGQLIVSDRCESIITLADGTKIAPQFIESSIRFSPYIKEAVVIGNDRPFLAALICIDGKVAGKWAGDSKLAYGTYSDLAAKPEIYELIGKELAAIMADLPVDCRIKRFTILYKDLDPDDGEMTRTGKVRRSIVAAGFGEVIEALYRDDDSLRIDSTIDLGEGKTARVQSTLLFRNLV